MEQSPDAKTNVSPVSRRRDARRSLEGQTGRVVSPAVTGGGRHDLGRNVRSTSGRLRRRDTLGGCALRRFFPPRKVKSYKMSKLKKKKKKNLRAPPWWRPSISLIKKKLIFSPSHVSRRSLWTISEPKGYSNDYRTLPDC